MQHGGSDYEGGSRTRDSVRVVGSLSMENGHHLDCPSCEHGSVESSAESSTRGSEDSPDSVAYLSCTKCKIQSGVVDGEQWRGNRAVFLESELVGRCRHEVSTNHEL